MMIYSPLSSLINFCNPLTSSRAHADEPTGPLCVYKSLLVVSVALAGLFGCEKPERCTVNSECGIDHLCRDGACKPKCLTYRTCEEGEACVDGACEIPTADYCSHVIPAQTPPEMGPYEPCPPSEMSVSVEGMAGAMMASDPSMMNMTAGESVADQDAGSAAGTLDVVAGETAAGETAAGESAAGESAAGEAAAGEAAAGEATAGETAAGETTAGDVIEVVGGQTEEQ